MRVKNTKLDCLISSWCSRLEAFLNCAIYKSFIVSHLETDKPGIFRFELKWSYNLNWLTTSALFCLIGLVFHCDFDQHTHIGYIGNSQEMSLICQISVPNCGSFVCWFFQYKIITPPYLEHWSKTTQCNKD